MRTIEDVLTEHAIGYDENGTGELILGHCPFCGTHKKKIYVQSETGLFICFRCDTRGGAVKLVSKLLEIPFGKARFILYGKDAPKNLNLEEDEEELIALARKIRIKKEEELIPIQKDHYFKKLTPKNEEAWNYLLGRGLTPEVIEKTSIWHWAWAKRIVFPVIMDGQLYGTLARDYTGTQQPKVINSRGNFRRFCLWNFDNAKDSEDLIICEGAISAIKCGIHRSVALLGKVATSHQIKKIRKTNANRIYVCLDIGTEKEQFQFYSQLNIYYPGRVYKINLPPVRRIKCPKCGRLTDLHDDETHFNCDCGFKSYGFDLRDLRKKFEHLDSGDYTYEQMEEFIQKATPFRGGPTSWE